MTPLSVEQPPRQRPRPSARIASNARASLCILLAASVVAASVPREACADVGLPPPPKRPSSSSTPNLPPPPPPAKKKASEGTAKPAEATSSNSGPAASGGGSSSAKSSDRTTAIVLLATGGILTIGGTTMLLVGAGFRPDGKKGGGQSGVLVAGAVTTTIGLGVATIGLVLLLRSNNGRLPPIKSLTSEGHPATRAPAWLGRIESPPSPYGAALSTLSIPIAAGTF